MKQGRCIISGYINGQKFRPSNWSERLCEVGGSFDPAKRVMRYSEHFYPRQCKAYGCSVYVDFDNLDIELVNYISWFVESNGLEVVTLSQRGVRETDTTVVAIVETQTKATVPFPLKSTRNKVAA